MRNRSALALTSVIALGLAGLVATPAHAVPIPATDSASLINAINTANSAVGPDVITLTGPLTITLAGNLPPITDTLTVEGSGSGSVTLDAAGFDSFASTGSVTNTEFSLSGITIENAAGPAVDTDSLSVSLTDLVVDSQIEHAYGDFSATDVEVTESPSGYGMYIQARLDDIIELTRVTVSATFFEGIYLDAVDDAVVSLTDVLVTGSGLDFWDGASLQMFDDARLEVIDSEFSDNFSDGIQVEAFQNAVVLLDNITANNNEFDGIDVDADDSAQVTMRDSSADNNGDNGFESDIDGSSAVLPDLPSSAALINLTAEGNSDFGFDVEADGGSTVTLTNPVAIDNEEYGVMVEPDTPESTVTVVGGRGEGNGFHGLFLNVDTGTATSTGFLARDNGEGGVLITGYDGTATLRNATVVDNNEIALTAGGGVDIFAGADENEDNDDTGALNVLIEGTTISGNEALFGGGISGTIDYGSTFTLLNSTISGNEAGSASALTLESSDDSEMTIAHSTITLNTTTDEVEAVIPVGMQVTIMHSIIAGNLGPAAARDLGEDTSTLDIDYSLVQTADANSLAALAAGTGNVVGQPTGLGPLANNGGPTLTHLPLDGSAAIGAGNPAIAGAPAIDQRGLDRIRGIIEIGSVEVQTPELAATGFSRSTAALAPGVALLLVLGTSLVLVARRRSAMTVTN